MKLLYFRCSVRRKPKFQTKISIYDDGNKHVKREAVHLEGISHIKKIFDNSVLGRTIYGEHAAEDFLQERAVITPYYDGVTLGDVLCRAFLYDDAGKIKSLLAWWKELVIGNRENICCFDETESFRKIFGGGKEFLGAPATKISNCDCSSENIIILGENQYRIIDMEWLFDFPVPVDFIWYRVVKQFMLAHHFNVGENRLLYYAEINPKMIDSYERLESCFQSFISYDTETGIDYNLFGRQFLDAHVDMGDSGESNIRYFPRINVPEGSRICLYAAGAVGVDFYHYLKDNPKVHLVAWTDKRANIYIRQGMDLMPISQITKINFDYVLIAVSNAVVANEIQEELKDVGISEDKILWDYPRISE